MEDESGIKLESLSMGLLRKYVMDGNWKALVSMIPELGWITNSERKIRFLVRKQQFLEELEQGSMSEALIVLQDHLTPLGFTSELHALSRY